MRLGIEQANLVIAERVGDPLAVGRMAWASSAPVCMLGAVGQARLDMGCKIIQE